MSFSKAEYMLKYQKAKVKLLEYEIEQYQANNSPA